MESGLADAIVESRDLLSFMIHIWFTAKLNFCHNAQSPADESSGNSECSAFFEAFDHIKWKLKIRFVFGLCWLRLPFKMQTFEGDTISLGFASVFALVWFAGMFVRIIYIKRVGDCNKWVISIEAWTCGWTFNVHPNTLDIDLYEYMYIYLLVAIDRAKRLSKFIQKLIGFIPEHYYWIRLQHVKQQFNAQ